MVEMRWSKIEEFKSRAYQSELSNFDLFDAWAKDKAITHYSNDYGYCKPEFPEINITLPFFDHLYFFKNNGTKEMWLTSQPYHEVDAIREKTLSWCEKNNMTVEFLDASQSWYYPGSTCLLVFKNK